MMQDNPVRVDYYERYQEIIEAYNSGKEYAAVKEIFDQLVRFLADLNEEEKRAMREELSEEELAVFDLLGRDKKISDKEKAELKAIAKALLAQLKEREFKVIQWAEKEQTASEVKKVITDYLFMNLPHPAFDESDVSTRSGALFEFFKSRYAVGMAA
jgi:type I restriction enzyme R subunit